jgi:hypothetical protein
MSYELPPTGMAVPVRSADDSARPALLGGRRGPQQANPGNCRLGLRALERDEDIPGPNLRLERDGPALV